MLKYFDKTFFRFLIGFIIILAVSFGSVIIANYFQSNRSEDISGSQTAMEFSAEDECLTDVNC